MKPLESASGELVWITPSLGVLRDHINVGVIRDGDRALLIDCSESVVAKLGDAGVSVVDMVLFTHHHRDQACGVHDIAASGAQIAVPSQESQWFSDVGSFWNDPDRRWRTMDYHPNRLVLTESVRVDRSISDGEVIEWGPARITAVATPGHTLGSLSYIVEIDGLRVAFCGDLIYNAGQIWDIYSLQKAINATEWDYHGFMGLRGTSVDSLRRLQSMGPNMLVPSHGEVMPEPNAAAEALIDRLQVCYDNYVDISAMRYYFPQAFPEYPADYGMPISPDQAIPEFLRRVGYGWTLISETGGVFVLDCGVQSIVDGLKEMLADGECTSIDALWISHYHFDHIDSIPALRKITDCECIADESVAEVITHPLAWRLPGMSPDTVVVDRVPREGERWRWHEFTITSYHFPGQTLYHDALFIEGRGLRMFFIGDSFTPSGIDDYCPLNRNFLGDNVGYDRCVRLVRELKPDLMFNPHVPVAFTFTDEQCAYMLRNLSERERLFGELLPWDHANYGLDDLWARCYPYEQAVRPGGQASVEVVVTNHSTVDHELRARIVPPRSWQARPGAGSGDPRTAGDFAGPVVCPAKTDTRLALSLMVPSDVAPGRWPIAVDVEFGGRKLPRITETVLLIA